MTKLNFASRQFLFISVSGQLQRHASNVSEVRRSIIPDPNDRANVEERVANVRKKPLLKYDIIFGIHPVLEALRQRRRRLHTLYVRHDFEESPKLRAAVTAAQAADIHVETSSPKELDRLTRVDKFNNFRPHQGACLRCSPLHPTSLDSYDQFLSSAPLFSQWLFPVLVDVKDPMNFGGILRSGAFFGLRQMMLFGPRSIRRPTPVVSKASSGAAESMVLWRLGDAVSFLTQAKAAGDVVVGTVAPDDDDTLEPLVETNPRLDHDVTGFSLVDVKTGHRVPSNVLKDAAADGEQPSTTFLLFGSEGEGLDESLTRLCDYRLGISAKPDPTTFLDSLNVSVAAGIAFHELLTE